MYPFKSIYILFCLLAYLFVYCVLPYRDLFQLDDKDNPFMTDDVTDTTKFRIVIDQMDNLFSRMFNAHPDRIIFLRGNEVAYLGNPIYKQLRNPQRLMTHEARDWLIKNVGPPSTKLD